MVNCVLICDIVLGEMYFFLMNCCLGLLVEQVIQNVWVGVNGLLVGSVLLVFKYMFGYGCVKVDSYYSLLYVDVLLFVVFDIDFVLFCVLVDMLLGMMVYIIFVGVGLQFVMQNVGLIDVIWNDIGFDGLLMIDDISMEVLSGLVIEWVWVFWVVGCDVVLYCNG